MTKLALIGAALVVVLILAGILADHARAVPPVRGGYVGKPYPLQVNRRTYLCQARIYADGVIFRCVLTKGVA